MIAKQFQVDDPNYIGDSYINMISDVIVTVFGYIFVVYTGWYGAPIYYVASEVFSIWYYRNSFTLMIVLVASQLFGSTATKILEWQAGAFGGKVWLKTNLESISCT